MLLVSVVAFFRFKLVSNIVILACWPAMDRVKYLRELHYHGVQASFSCNPAILDRVQNDKFLGIIVFGNDSEHMLEEIKSEHTSSWYKWLIIHDSIPKAIDSARYDADITLLTQNNDLQENESLTSLTMTTYFYYEDVYVDLGIGASSHPWAVWSQSNGLQVLYEREKILRRSKLKGYPFRIATPLGHYADGLYNGTFDEYLRDDTKPEHDPTIRCGYGSTLLLSDSLNATVVLIPTLFWTSEADNSSMLPMVAKGNAELTGTLLRILQARVEVLDFLMPLWPFSVGFTYLAERESSGNMFVTPFSPGVWWSCLGAGAILALVLRITSRKALEKDGALYAVLATWLQQDASAVPEGASGRWTFMVMSVCSMLVHAYYTSAIVSALMSAGRSGPANLRELADSRYAIASEDYDYMRYFMFDRHSNRSDLEYLKRKKMTKNFYHSVERGAELIKTGDTAYHTEYINIYPYISKFPDEKICKLAYVDTYSSVLAWTATTKRSQFTNMMRSAGNWIHETGLRTRLVSRWNSQPAPCRTALLAERVKFGDVAPLMGVTALSVVVSLMILGLEIIVAKWSKNGDKSDATAVSDDEFDEEVDDRYKNTYN